MLLNVTFSDFYCEKSFVKLQSRFLALDKAVNFFELNRINGLNKSDFTINYLDISESIEKGSDVVHTVSFYDLLRANLNDISSRYLVDLEYRMDDKGIFIKDEKIAFINSEINRLYEVESQIFSFDFLPLDIHSELVNQIQITNDFLNEKFIPELVLEDKFKFNLNKTDLVYFFYLLRQNKILNSSYTDSQLGRLIDRYLLYKKDSNDVYEKVKLSRAVLNKNKNQNVTLEKSVKRLKEIFCNDQFYQLK